MAGPEIVFQYRDKFYQVAGNLYIRTIFRYNDHLKQVNPVVGVSIGLGFDIRKPSL